MFHIRRNPIYNIHKFECGSRRLRVAAVGLILDLEYFKAFAQNIHNWSLIRTIIPTGIKPKSQRNDHYSTMDSTTAARGTVDREKVLIND